MTLLVMISSCSSMYIPSSTNIPLLSDKGEIQGELTAGTTSLHLSGDYAFSKKYAIMVNGSISYGNFTNRYDFLTDKNSYDVQSLTFKSVHHYGGEFEHIYGEVGIGRYNVLNKILKLEVFGGIGYGIDKDKSPRGTLYDANYYLGFAQINIGKTFDKYDFGCALRIASSYFDYSFEIDPYNANDNDRLPKNVKFGMFHAEPMGFLRFGKERLKFVVRLGLSFVKPYKSLGKIDANRGIYDGDLKTTHTLISIGINYKLTQKKE
jgi:hypothetical protein